MRRHISALIVLVVLSPAWTASADAPEPDPIVVAIIDTGLDAAHPEFDAGQVVAWWDFTTERKPAARTDPFASSSPAWDPDVPTPFDGNGHGTAVASVLAGHNRGSCASGPKEAHAPGVRLAIAKVGTASGSISGDLALAWRWAVEVAHADVVSFSIGGVAPTPALSAGVFDAIRAARENGTLPVVLAHNGLANSGAAPFPSWANQFSSSPYAFVVSGGARNGATLTSTTGNLDPDVAAWSDGVCVAIANTPGYGSASGTSFATPLVAGMAASAIREARASGAADSPDVIADVLRGCARDTIAPYAKEGWGFLGPPEVPCILANAASGTQPSYRSFTGLPVNENEAYDETVRAPMRSLFGDPRGAGPMADALVLLNDLLVSGPPLNQTATPLVRTALPVLTAAGEIGASGPVGIAELEAYAAHVPAGERFTATLFTPATVAGRPGVPDLDLALYPRAAYESGTLRSTEALARSSFAAGRVEEIAWRATEDADVVLVVIGVSVAAPATYDLRTTHAAPFDGQAVYAGVAVAPGP